MSEQPTCKGPREKTLRGIFGQRCGKPATGTDPLGRTVCAECLAWAEEMRGDARTLGGVLADIFKRRTAAPKRPS